MLKMNVNTYRNCSFLISDKIIRVAGYLFIEPNMAFNTLLSSPLPTSLQLML
jgi:hypothetical protein